MSEQPSPSPDEIPYTGARANAWIAFAAVLLFVTGCFGVLYGLAAILNDQVATVGSGGHGVVIWDFTTWGWITLIIGSAQVLVSLGLFSGASIARWFAIAFAVLSALAQFGIVTAFPLWGMLVITFDVVIVYQLLVNWEERL